MSLAMSQKMADLLVIVKCDAYLWKSLEFISIAFTGVMTRNIHAVTEFHMEAYNIMFDQNMTLARTLKLTLWECRCKKYNLLGLCFDNWN